MPTTVRHGLGRESALALLAARLLDIEGASVRPVRSPGNDSPAGAKVGDLILSLPPTTAAPSNTGTSAWITADDLTTTATEPGGETWPVPLADAIRRKVEKTVWTQRWIDVEDAAGRLSPNEVEDAIKEGFNLKSGTEATINRYLDKASRVGKGVGKAALWGAGIYSALRWGPGIVKAVTRWFK